MKKVLLFFLIFFSFSFGKTAIYRAYFGFIPVGEIKFIWDNDTILVKGNVYSYLKSFYNYDFEFRAADNDFFLYEHENRKVRVYKGEKLYQKKPWLPLIVNFLKTGKEDKNSVYPYRLKKEGKNFIIYPLKSKKVKKIVLKMEENSRFPVSIRIYGKHYIKLEKIKEKGKSP